MYPFKKEDSSTIFIQGLVFSVSLKKVVCHGLDHHRKRLFFCCECPTLI